ncbi:hypothetical protein H8N00_12585 [Streptomyces sp. AC563]|uniref:hypothetical protein n=1 Tax=Streptomyces buecherae TaxID=2763006 RepID=UPI00164D84AE|nr:hypothetical protein [Streptomyces buecherae]MBC3989696.1 hypothetical protein [Streptomyces buecherae]
MTSAPQPKLGPAASPAYLTVGKRCHLTVTATNTTGGDVKLTSFLLRFPKGTGEKDLTDSDQDGLTVKSSLPARQWRRHKAPLPGTALEVGLKAATHQGVNVKNNGKIDFTVEMPINHTPGTVQTTVAQNYPNERERTCLLPLPKMPTGFHVGNFRPTPWTIKAGESTRVTWEREIPKGVTVSHDLYYSTPNGTVPLLGIKGTTSDFITLHHHALFTLITHVTPPSQQSAIDARLTTFVTLTRPHLNIGPPATLKASHAVNLLHTPRSNTGELPGYSRYDERTAPITGQHFTCTTDGLLLATTEAPHRDCTITLTLHLGKTPDDPRPYTAKIFAREEENLLLPVPAGHIVTLKASTDRPEATYLVALDWRPLGMGGMHPISS